MSEQHNVIRLRTLEKLRNKIYYCPKCKVWIETRRHSPICIFCKGKTVEENYKN